MAAVVLAGFLFDTTLGPDLQLFGVVPDEMLLLAIIGGLTGGPEAGALVGFAAGLLADVSLTTTPIGLCALSWCLVGWGSGLLRARLLPEARSALPVVAFLATLAGVILFLVIGDLVGQSQLMQSGRSHLVRVAVIESVWSALLALPTAWVYERAAAGSAGVVGLRRAETQGAVTTGVAG
jgi:rod shape-determining protein MreD